jgi:hypothetical protein
MKKRLLSLSLVLVVVFALVPSAFALSDADIEQIYQYNLAVFNTRSASAQALEFYRQPDANSQSGAKTITDLAASVTAGASGDMAKAKAIHDYVSYNIWYDYDVFEGRVQRPSQDALTTLANRRSVCEGYTNLTVALLRAAGLPAKSVSGNAFANYSYNGQWVYGSITLSQILNTGSNHDWTEAYIGGRWVIIDTTWDSDNEYRNGRYETQKPVKQRFFDISLRELSKNRTLLSYDAFVTEAVIPAGITRILDRLFYNCINLASVTIPNSVTSIDYGAFFNCPSLAGVYIPSSVTEIADNAFHVPRWVPGSTTQYYINYNVTIYGEPGSYAQTYAKENGIPFIAGRPPTSTLTASPAPGTVYVNGAAKKFECYVVNGTTYFKLMDVATALNGTSAQFSISTVSGGLNLTKGAGYAGTQQPLNTEASRSYTATELTVTLSVNGAASGIKGYQINGASYYEITPLGNALGFKVERDRNKASAQYPNGPIELNSYVARPAPGTVYVNGQARTFECYEIDGTTYFKLVDVGEALKDTPGRFSITPSGGTLNLTTGAQFNDGSALNTQASSTYNAMPPTAAVTVNGQAVDLKSYRINGLHYYQITPLCAALGVSVGRDAGRASAAYPNGPIVIEA